MKIASIKIDCCANCPHFFTDGWLFEGDAYCSNMDKNVKIHPDEAIDEDCPLPDIN